MKKLLSTQAALLLLSVCLAQSPRPILYSAAVDGGIATSKFNDNFKWGLGASLQADIPVGKQLYTTLNAGYLNFYNRNNDNVSNKDLHLLPVKAGLKYFPVRGFYVQAEAGAGFLLNKSVPGYNRATAFIYAPQVGIQLPVNKTNRIDAGLRYERSTQFASAIGNSRVNYLGLRVAYAFSL